MIAQTTENAKLLKSETAQLVRGMLEGLPHEELIFYLTNGTETVRAVAMQFLHEPQGVTPEQVQDV